MFSSYFVTGEEELKATTDQLKSTGRKANRKKYKADAVVRFLLDAEVLVLETTGSFSKNDERKAVFGHAKRIFALLAMLKTIVDKYYFGNAGTSGQLKWYFLQPAGNIILYTIQ